MFNIPHFYYAFIVAMKILEGMYRTHLRDSNIIFCIDKEKVNDFVKMAYSNEKLLFEPIDRRSCHETENLVFCLSNIFYYFEQTYSIKK